MRVSAEAGVRRNATHEGVGEHRLDALGDVGGIAPDEEERVEIRVVLMRQRAEHLFEPRPRLMDHHNAHDRRSGCTNRIHGVRG